MRFRLRFSLRTLAIVVTLICAYFGAWEATKRFGVPSLGASKSPMPFIVYESKLVILGTAAGLTFRELEPRVYYVWLFGMSINLPGD
jgi:hypothetical protein